MSSETYHFENQKLETGPKRVFSQKVELNPLFVRRDNPGNRTLSRDASSSDDMRRAYFDVPSKNNSFIERAGKTSLILTLATAELLVSATAVLAGTVFAGAWIHYPIGLLFSIPMTVGPLVPVLVISSGVIVGALGLRQMNSALRKMKSLF